jgi:putative colanic acid biosynthesis glycosyltransferase
MKVLQINSVCGVGSTGRIVTDIHQNIIAQGHESYIAYGRDHPRNCDAPIRIGNRFANYAHYASTKFFDKHGFGTRYYTRVFVKQVEYLNPDVIHLHNIHGYYINIEILFGYLKKANKPVFWTLHDCWAFTGHCAHFDYINCNKWKTSCFNCPQKDRYPSSFVDNSKENYITKKNIFTGVKNMTIVTPSEWLAKLVKESFLGDYPIEIINNGINLEVFRPTKSDFRKRFALDNKYLILGVASFWGEKKGFNYFLELSDRSKSDEQIILVGLTEKQKRKLPANIIGITRTHNIQELAEIYSAADVFVNPTLEDTFPTTNLESLACGTPVITFNTGGSVEIVNEKCGIIVEKGNIDDLCDALRKIKYERFSKNECVKRAKLFDKNTRFNDYIKLYLNSLTMHK